MNKHDPKTPTRIEKNKHDDKPAPKTEHHPKAHAKKEQTIAEKVTAPTLAADAYAKILPEIEALRASDVRSITVDVPRAITTAIGAVPAILALRDQIVRHLPSHRIDSIDNLEQYALGAWYANMLAMPASSEVSALKVLLDEAAPLKEALLVAAEALAHRALFDATRVAEIRSGQGNLDTANDLVALAALFTAQWDEVAMKTAVNKQEVDRAAALASELLLALGAREQPSRGGSVAAAADRRARAFTLVVDSYDQCRRAVAYLRWNEGDADTIAPSLFRQRAGRRSASSDASNPTPPEPPAPTPAPAPAGAAAPATNGAPTPVA